ncbi:MAG: acetylglutamate kinase [Turicibacter sp.]|nr:acetylglutamate kinase [Turicibacter sp.]
MIDQATRGRILSEALPYIRQYSKKTVVIKYGGSAMTDPELKKDVLTDIALLSMASIRVVIVHGGGPEINQWLKKLDIQPKFIDGLRYTDDATMDVVQMTLAGKVGKELAAQTTALGGKAVSLCGLDGNLLKAKQLDEKYGLVGDLVQVDSHLIETLLDSGYIPIISSTASGEHGETYNINADIAASAVAVALNAERLMLLTDVPGILTDPSDPETLIHEMGVSQIPILVKNGIISGGMIPKLKCCEEAIRRGVARAHILDGRLSHSILMEMLTDGGVGTMITA